MWGYGYTNMMGGFETIGLFGFLTWVALFAFLVLGSVYFWKGLKKQNGKR